MLAMWGKIYVGDITIAGLCPYCLCPICGFNSNQTMSPMIKFQFISRQVVMIFILRVLHVLCGEFSAFLGSPTNVHFLLNGQKKVNRKKSRRRCFIGQFSFYTNSVNLNTLKTTSPSRNMAFSSSHPVLIQKPRRSPLRRSKLLLYVIAVNTLCL